MQSTPATRPWPVSAEHPNAPLPVPLVVATGLPVVAGIALGLAAPRRPPERALRAVFFGSAFGYLAVSLVDFAEHFRLEREMTGRWFAATAVPIGETANHAGTALIILTTLLLLRPAPRRLAPRDWIALLAPGAFLALGWRDELVYHRRRSVHREDMLHTVAHLAVGVMLTAFYTLRSRRW